MQRRGIVLERSALGQRRHIAAFLHAAAIATGTSRASRIVAGMVARFAAVGRIVEHFATVDIAATGAAPGVDAEQPANPSERVEAEIALAATAAVVAASAALAATGAPPTTGAPAAIVGIDGLAIGTVNRTASRAAFALAPAAALAATSAVV